MYYSWKPPLVYHRHTGATSDVLSWKYVSKDVQYVNDVMYFVVSPNCFTCRFSNLRLCLSIILVCMHIRNGCILILWMNWRPAMGSGGSRTLGASLSVWGYRSRLLGNGFKIKSVTPYSSQSEKGTQPWGGGQFSTSPWERTGGIGREEMSWGPSVNGKGTFNFFLSFPRGRGGEKEGEKRKVNEIKENKWKKWLKNNNVCV